MHTQEYRYTEEDFKYSDDKSVQEVNFHYNSDLSGEIIIANEIAVIRVPGWMLLEFVGRHVQSELISSIEQLSGRETLMKTSLSNLLPGIKY